jgi:hypothetical protein
MLVFHEHIFDEIVTGTADSWYTSSEHNKLFATADVFTLFVVATDVSGTGALTLNLDVEASADNEHWLSPEPVMSGTLLTSGPFVGTGFFFTFGLPFARLKAALGGTNPQCRLQLRLTGRTF